MLSCLLFRQQFSYYVMQVKIPGSLYIPWTLGTLSLHPWHCWHSHDNSNCLSSKHDARGKTFLLSATWKANHKTLSLRLYSGRTGQQKCSHDHTFTSFSLSNKCATSRIKRTLITHSLNYHKNLTDIFIFADTLL